jgi:ketosteroid isomerase-like protein
MTANQQQIFERYIWAGAMTHDADAQAELFTPDGVYEAPLVPGDWSFPRRLEGREEIRRGFAAVHARSAAAAGRVDADRSRYVLHATADPDVFIVELDTALHGSPTMSLVQIFRIRDGKIALLRDYFDPDLVAEVP